MSIFSPYKTLKTPRITEKQRKEARKLIKGDRGFRELFFKGKEVKASRENTEVIEITSTIFTLQRKKLPPKICVEVPEAVQDYESVQIILRFRYKNERSHLSKTKKKNRGRKVR